MGFIRTIFAMSMLLCSLPARGETLTVSAAISLKESLTQIAALYEKTSSDRISFNFDASGKLVQQIKQGAPVDAFISADQEQMNKLGEKAANRRTIVGNNLVLVVPPDSKDAPTNFADLAVDHGKKIAIGEPKTVPAGRYAIQTFKSLKLDQTVSSRLVFGESVRQVLTYVQQGQVSAGVVYGTDAKQAGYKVKVVATADANTHEPIEYPAAVVAASTHAMAAAKFLDFLTTEPAQKIFVDKGFSIPAPTTRPSP